MSCALCATRKPRRFCPAVAGEICTVCCASSREQSLDCPLSCEHLLQAHQHERVTQTPAGDGMPKSDMTLSEQMLRDNEWFFAALLPAIANVARRHPAVNDWDARDALDSLVRTWRTLQSGLYYESKPVNLRAGDIYQAARACIADIQETAEKAGERGALPDAVVLAVLVFLHRLERIHNNGKPRSRAFLAFLCEFTPAREDPDLSDVSVQPPAPLLIL